jgi:hypothetical protein
MDSTTLIEPPTRDTVRRLLPAVPSELSRTLLIVTTGDDAPRLIEFGDREVLTVGRAEPSEVCIGDSGVSRMHARFSREPNGIRVMDLGSRNGTWLRGARVDEALLAAGECVVIGSSSVLIHTTLSPSNTSPGSTSANAAFKFSEGTADPIDGLVTTGGVNLRLSLQEHEAKLIREALRLTSGNQRRAAALLELPLRTFERKLRNITLRRQRTAAQQQ